MKDSLNDLYPIYQKKLNQKKNHLIWLLKKKIKINTLIILNHVIRIVIINNLFDKLYLIVVELDISSEL